MEKKELPTKEEKCFCSFLIVGEDSEIPSKKIENTEPKKEKIIKNVDSSDFEKISIGDIPKENKIIKIQQNKINYKRQIPKSKLNKENSFLIKNDFCIYNKEEQNFSNNIIESYFRNDEENIIKNRVDRSDSSDLDTNCSKRFKRKKQGEYNKNEHERKLERPESFKTECFLYDKNKISYKTKLIIDRKFNVIFCPEKETDNFKSDYYTFPLLYIKNISQNTNYLGQNTNFIELQLKDYRNFLFKLPSPNTIISFNNIIEKYSFPNKNKYYFDNAYLSYDSFKLKHKNIEYIDGWKLYNFKEEFKRQNVDLTNTYKIFNNSNFKLCSSYPKEIIVPVCMSDSDIIKCANFRTKERIPVLTYRYNKNGCCIWRSSQTKTGIMGKNEKDVLLLTKISESSKKLIIYDARPKLNAWANKLKGAGFEIKSNYPNIDMEIIFCGIPNIHSIRNSYQKMFENISYNMDEENRVIANLQNTFWYEAIILLLKSSFQIYESILQNCTVLIHCSDGWDRTSQLAATSQILLDKFYRTLDGFIILIEKDWISFGHQFRYRNGFYSQIDPETPTNVLSENQFSPIFIQWLDSIHQLMLQNYTFFEFNHNLITFLAYEMYSGKYGTFLFNNEFEREKYHAKKKTVSIWTFVKEKQSMFLNPIYDPDNDNPLFINYKKISLWGQYFYRFEKGNDEFYTEVFNKKFNNYKENIAKDKEIIEGFRTFIQNQLKNNIDISSLSEECKNLINQNNESIGPKINTSFEILAISDSVLKYKTGK